MLDEHDSNLLPMRKWLFYRIQFGVLCVLALSFLLFVVVLQARLQNDAVQEQVRVLAQYERIMREDLRRSDLVMIADHLEALANASEYSRLSLFRDDHLLSMREGRDLSLKNPHQKSFTITHGFAYQGYQYRLEAMTPLAAAERMFNAITALIVLFGVFIVTCIAMIHHRVTKHGSQGISSLATHIGVVTGRLRAVVQSEAALTPAEAEQDLQQSMTDLAALPADTHESVAVQKRFSELMQLLSESWKTVERQRSVAAIGEMSQQVAHDIRSPLTALHAISRNMSEMPEEKRVVIRNAVQRIDDITNDLANSQVQSVEAKGVSSELLSSLIDPLLSEKRTQYRARSDVRIESHVDANSYAMFAKVNSVEFKRVISNIINNAVEAMSGAGVVTVRLDRDDESAVLQIIDDGAGIPADILPTLAQRGVTVGKDAGSGLGLYHARTTVEGWGGSFEIASTVGVGTTITLRLPLAPAPAWFVEELELFAGQPVIVLDDDSSIHHVWAGRFSEYDFDASGIAVHSCKTPEQLRELCADLGPATFLCDYELLGSKETGLDMIEELGIADQAILVSSRYAEPSVRKRCEALGVRMIPKGLASIVPITIVEARDPSTAADACAQDDLSVAQATSTHRHHDTPTQRPTILVIDDSQDIKFAWSVDKFRLGVETVHFFFSMEECEAAGIDYTSITHAFLDKNIPDSTWDLPRTIAYLKAQGVAQVVVASGEKREDLLDDPQCAGADAVLALKVPQDDGYFSVCRT